MAEASVRARSKQRTRQALVDAALDLFAADGYDETSTDAIAARAGVSPRTFFRYFPTKESVLFFGEYDYIRSFTGVFLAQPAAVTDLEAMWRSFCLLAPGLGRLRERIQLYERAVASSPLLRGREQETHAENVAEVAAAVARRRGLADPDADCELLAAVGLVVLRRAFDRWLQASDPEPTPFVEAEFRRLVALAGR